MRSREINGWPLITIVMIALITPMIWYGAYMYSLNQITTHLEDDGYTNVKLYYRFWSGHPLTLACSSKDSTVRAYTAEKDGHPVSGVACQEFWYGVKNWDD